MNINSCSTFHKSLGSIKIQITKTLSRPPGISSAPLQQHQTPKGETKHEPSCGRGSSQCWALLCNYSHVISFFFKYSSVNQQKNNIKGGNSVSGGWVFLLK